MSDTVTSAFDRGRAPQRRAADPTISAWVAANAGTGKTRVLVERVIRLLLAGTRPDRILCLTFTKAAAAEMAERLFKILGGWTMAPDSDVTDQLREIAGIGQDAIDLARARRLFAQAIETPGGLKIQTIHAFAQAVLRRFPREAGIAPHFTVMDEREAQVLLTHARDQIFSTGRQDPAIGAAIRTLAPYLNEDGIDDLLKITGAARNEVRRMIKRHGSLAQAMTRLSSLLGIDDQTDEAALDRALVDPMIDHARMIRALSEGSPTDKARAQQIAAFLAAPDQPETRAAYLRVFLTKDGKGLDRLMTKAAIEFDPGALELMEAEQARILALEARRRACRLVAASAATLTLGLAVLERFEAEKRRRARLDYNDLIDHCLSLLSAADAAPWVLFKLDGGLEHVLVDEAQDTSPGQWDIVRALTDEFMSGMGAGPEPRTVFAVGDAKQSIYGFQGADPKGFERMRHYFAARMDAAHLAFDNVDLNLSFRSTREVLDAVDAVFAGPAGQGLAGGDPIVSHRAYRQTIPGRVELWETVKPEPFDEQQPWTAPVDQESSRSPRKVLAERIAAKIASWLGANGETITDDSNGPAISRPIRPGDILILVRRRDAFVDEMIRALKQRHIPVAGADRMRLDAQIAVMDLAAAARVCLLPQDDLTLACLLKSPLIGYSDDDLFALAYGRGPISLWAALWQSSNPRDAAAVKLIAGWRAMARVMAPFDFFAHILNAGGRRRLLARLGPEANDGINELLAQALNFERMETPSLEAFMHWLSSVEVEIKRDMDQSGDQVRVMTVHGAKGLEANIVFLPDTCAQPGGRSKRRLETLGEPDANEGPEALAFAPMRALETEQVLNARLAARLEEETEHYRLLYVAMTRARNWLYITGHEPRGRNGAAFVLPANSWYALTSPVIQKLATPMVDETGAKIWRIDYGAPAPELGASLPDLPESQAIPSWVQEAPAPERRMFNAVAPSRLGEQEPPPRSPLQPSGAARFKRGRLIHRLLQTLPDLETSDRPLAARRYLDQVAGDLDPDQRQAIADETLAVLAHPDFADLFGPSGQAEVAITGHVPALGPDISIAGQVDRLLVTDSHVLIVDYKTNRPPPHRVEEVARPYLRQMAAYREALRALYPGRQVRCALLWTDGPRLMGLDDGLLDQALAEISHAATD